METLHLAENLKNNTRHSWTSKGRQESAAEHSRRLTLLARLVADESQADMNRVIKCASSTTWGRPSPAIYPHF